jgi:hypothetical protein
MRSLHLGSITLCLLVIIGISGCAAKQPDQITPTASAEIAPSYDEIFDTMYVLSGHDRFPDGPPVGPDGISDPEIREAVEDYNAALQGKRVENWTGWVASFSHSQAGHPDKGYNLDVWMREPSGNHDPSRFVVLKRVPREQVEKITPPLDLEAILGSWNAPLPKITFSGTILRVAYTGQVYLGDVTLEPASAN